MRLIILAMSIRLGLLWLRLGLVELAMPGIVLWPTISGRLETGKFKHVIIPNFWDVHTKI